MIDSVTRRHHGFILFSALMSQLCLVLRIRFHAFTTLALEPIKVSRSAAALERTSDELCSPDIMDTPTNPASAVL